MYRWTRFQYWWCAPSTQAGAFTLLCVVGIIAFLFLLFVAVGYYTHIYLPLTAPIPPVDPGARYQLSI